MYFPSLRHLQAIHSPAVQLAVLEWKRKVAVISCDTNVDTVSRLFLFLAVIMYALYAVRYLPCKTTAAAVV
ncbi:hypothetical protein ASPWEDRAFT_237529 [Aspergillus wentii DTO 134E9]|uniref:Uncharacterized protein n=1 Tax=Aspergillus wentii DTO 134E9 TaxID=1073089 RepID=A0A1L9S1A0_ASPWE|nr:uncharacterized protein ASPWEDRAFT_237529 [Aspergillus wentii DTO 134E9]OJJ40903.1 hypothetical protein ASPWEDRAFT_237529 [Aspergillus wentii DTO 134E9]